MSSPRSSLSPEARALLDRERVIVAVPTSVRTRMLARARAALAAGRVTPAAAFRVAPRRRWALALAVALACMASAAVGAAAYGMLAGGIPAASAPPAALASLRIASIVARPFAEAARRSRAALTEVPNGEARSAPSAPASRVARSPQSDPGPEELRLLRQARAAVARQDFAAALPFIREHAQRFKSGRLTEEREALRVKALSGVGRTDEARRAADSFKVRFPRSVLSPAVTQMPAAEP